MPNELEHIDDSGLAIYAKPLPLVASPWSDDAIALAEVATTGYYSADVASPAQTYLVFHRSGASPTASDAPPVAAIDRATVEILTDTSTNLDAKVSTRLAAEDYAAPDNETLATIASLMPSSGRKIAGEGDTAHNLDQVQPGTLYVGTVVVSTPASSPAAISIVRGDAYGHADGRAFHFASASWPNLTGATVTFSATARATGQIDIAGHAMTVVTSEVVRLELSSAHTDGLQLGSAAYSFDIQATLTSGSKVTLVTGTINVARDHST